MKIVFMGTPAFAVPILEMLVEEGHTVLKVVTQPDRPKGRKRTLVKSPVKETAEKLGIEVFQPEKLRDPAAVETALTPLPDVIITAAYGQLLPEKILQTPKHGCINVHASLLPKYRGGAPIHQTVIDGEKETGITLMYMAKKLDAGDIIAQRSVPIGDKMTTGELHDVLSRTGTELLRETLPAIAEGDVQPVVQDETLATYAPNITREKERIDWSKSAQILYNQIRGLNPWPVAHTTWKGASLKLWETELMNETYENNTPGEVVEITNDSVVVSCGGGTGLALKVVQPAGKKAMPVADFLRGQGKNLSIGDVFADEQQ